MYFIPKSIQKAIDAFNKLPGIGQKSAERLVFYLLKKPESEIKDLGESIASLKDEIKYCNICKHLTTEDICEICKSEGRNKEIICVVEDSLDLIALEKSNEFKGLYHVLHGVISPIDGIGPDELSVVELINRIQEGGVKELILALNPSMEGEATSAYITRHIKDDNIKITRIARGIPVGGNLEYADSQTLKRAMEGRMEY